MQRSGIVTGAIITVAAAVLVGTQLASARTYKVAKPPSPAAAANCSLGKDGKIKHVIYVQFDNTHFLRDNPNVPSDLEQMPNLLNFIKSNGTLLTNDHSVLISHTGGGILSSLTGLYPDRHGQAVSNSYGYFRPDGSVGFSSSFKYWTDNTDGGNPANNPPSASADPNYNMVNNDSADLGGAGQARNAPAPWVPYTRAGCDVGGAGLANIELENNASIILRSPATSLKTASAVNATTVTVNSVDGLSAGQTVVLESGTANSELTTIASVGPPVSATDRSGTVTLTAGLAKAHAANAAFAVYTADPTGDMTKVFGAGSSEWIEGRGSQIAPSNTAARALAQTDFVGYAIHCGSGGGICNANLANAANARPDPLPDEQGGYTGFKALFGAKYVNPAITGGSTCVKDTNGNPIADPFDHCGFPGFDGLTANVTLAMTAQMQEAGVPVTYAYISDAHDNHGKSGNIHIAYGPGEPGYVQQLKDYDKAFGDFFTRLNKDGITKDNTLFVFTVEEGDHFAGSTPTPAGCDGVTTPCNYAHVTEVNGDLKQIVATYNATHAGNNATTNFSVHSDMAPNVYITGNPARDSAAARTLERTLGDVSVTNPLHGNKEKLFVALADPVEEQLLHMVTADPARTPTFTPFAQGDYFLNASSTTPCAGNNLDNCVFIPNTTGSTQTFAWNHGGIQPEIATTWVGWIGPGIQKSQPGDDLWSDHADLRPTMLMLLGLKDTYVSDGRVLTDFLDTNALPVSLRQHNPTVEQLGAVYKQIMASFGQFSQDTLQASTAALASNSAGDKAYADTEAQLQCLGVERDAIAGQIRLALWNAEFNDQAIDQNDAKAWIDQANDLLDQTANLSCSGLSSSSVPAQKQLGKINHIVVIYEENHSFDNLFGGWEGVNGLSNADAAHTTQLAQSGAPLPCLPVTDVNLATPHASDACATNANQYRNAPFMIDDYLSPPDLTCPPTPASAFSSPGGNGWLKGVLTAFGLPTAGGCTRDLVHEYYQEQFQLNGGQQNRYVIGSDATGLSMGVYDTTQVPIYRYLHEKGHPDYAVSDDFFQAAFGGSFLNHQWLIAAATPTFPGAPAGLHSIIDSNGMPVAYPLYVPTGPVQRNPLTVTCPAPAAAKVCGDWAVNTMQPTANPQGAFGAIIPPQTAPTIGDRLTAAGIDWAWYSGGWSNANGDVGKPGYTNTFSASTPTHCSDPNVDPNSRSGVLVATYPRCPDALFQYHHQPFNYYANYAPNTPGRAHLQDEVAFTDLANDSTGECNLKAVSFIKPIGEENEHPGYASQPNGNDHLVDDLVKPIESGPCAKDTLVIVTYDEFGGQWDHVSPPGQGNDDGPHDVWGPGTRIPALTIAPHLRGDFVVDSTEHDTTSILATIEHRFGLEPLSPRDGAVPDMSSVFEAKKPK